MTVLVFRGIFIFYVPGFFMAIGLLLRRTLVRLYQYEAIKTTEAQRRKENIELYLLNPFLVVITLLQTAPDKIRGYSYLSLSGL